MLIVRDNHRVIQQVPRQVILQPDLVGIIAEVPPVRVERVPDISHADVLPSSGALRNILHLLQHILRSPGGVCVNEKLFASVIVDKTRLVRGARGKHHQDRAQSQRQ